jgi:hypothetical protein
VSGPALSADELAELEAAVRQALVSHDDSAISVVGYGEITTVVEWTAGGEPVACKRLPGLADAAAFESYKSVVERYIAQLATTGIEVPNTVVQHITAADGTMTAYCVQAVLASSSLVPRVMHECSHNEAVGVFAAIVDRVEATVTDRVGLDAQLSNWAWQDHRLRYVDISTPFLRDEHGREAFDVELHIASVPWALRGLVRAFFLDTILDKFYTVRGGLMDLLGNMIKERLDGLLPAFVEVANRIATPPFTVAEIEKYYRGDARLWALLQALRRADRWWQNSVRRRPYPFLLPKNLPR